MQKFFFLFHAAFLFSFSAAPDSGPRWDLNDVSILFPLPEKDQTNLLLPMADLVSEKTLSQFPRLSVRYDSKTIAQNLRVVAFRIDPIKRQIKLVWQPILPGAAKKMTALDMALHSFYQLSDAEFNKLLTRLQQFKMHKQGDSHLPLQVHPALGGIKKVENIKFLTQLIQQHCSEKNLVKITAMVLRGGDDMWAFMGFEIHNSILVPIKIPFTANGTTQLFINQAIPFTSFENFDVTPLNSPTNDPFVDSLLGASLKLKNHTSLTEVEVQQTLNSIFKIENPRLSSADDLDCVSCHISQPLRHWLQPQISVRTNEFQYLNPNYNLTSILIDPLNTRRIRGFGYFGTEPAISERVINESAEVAEFLNQQTISKKGKIK